MPPRRDDTRARIRADEIPWLLSGGTRFKIYPRRVAFAIPKRRGAVWIRWVGRPGRQLDRAWGINTSFKYRAGSTKLCYWPARFNAGYMIRFRACYTPLNLLEVFIYTYSSKYDFGRSKMGWSLIGGLRGLGPSFREWLLVITYHEGTRVFEMLGVKLWRDRGWTRRVTGGVKFSRSSNLMSSLIIRIEVSVFSFIRSKMKELKEIEDDVFVTFVDY